MRKRLALAVMFVGLFIVAGCNAPQRGTSTAAAPQFSVVIAAGQREAAPNSRVAVVAQATGAEAGGDVNYRWSASGGAFTNARAADTVWVAPQVNGVYTIAVTAISGEQSATASLTLEVLGDAAPATSTPEPGSGSGDDDLTNPAPTSTSVPAEPTSAPVEATVPAAPTGGSGLTGTIVYTCFNGSYDNICTINPDGGDFRQLTSTEATDFYPEIDGSSNIVFSSRRTGTFALYRMDSGGNNVTRLTEFTDLYAPHISPDGSRLVFVRATADGQNIWVANADGSSPQQITSSNLDIDPTWSPDGSKIAFASDRSGQREIYVMNADGGDVRQVTGGIAELGGRIDWSPDGTTLALYAGPAGDRDAYLVDVASSATTRLTQGGNNIAPAYSPDGDWLVFTSGRTGVLQLYRMRPDGREVTQLTFGSFSSWQPRWSP